MATYPLSTRVIIDGVEAFDDGTGFSAGHPTILDGLSFTWGRQTNVDQPSPGTCSFVLHEQLIGTITPMLDIIDVGSTVEVWVDADVPVTGVENLLVWSGFVTAIDGTAFGNTGIQVAVTASDAAAPLADETIGDTPWPAETVQARANRILAVAESDTTTITVDNSIHWITVSYRDVDAQPVLGLLQDLAQSVGGVLWVATNDAGNTFLWIEDPSNRASVRRFLIDATTGRVVIANNTRPTDASLMSAQALLEDPIHWTKDKTQSINTVDATWLEQGVDDNGLPTTTQHWVTTTQAGATTPRKLQIDTELTSAFDASALADRMLALTGGTNGWMASGLSVDTTSLERDDITDVSYATRVGTVVSLMSGTERLGRPVTLVDLPTWTPSGAEASVYLEGGTYTLNDGRWLMDLNVSAPSGQGQTATFADFAGTTIRMNDFDPSIRGVDCFGVAGPNSLPDVGFGVSQFGGQAFGT